MSYYDELEVSPKASAEVIRAAYKSLMQRHHPDKSPDPAAATQRAAQIAQAYGVLSNPDQRQLYDAQLLKHQQMQQLAAVMAAQPSGRAAKRPVAAAAAPRLQLYLAWGLIVFILGCGWLIHRLNTKSAVPPAMPLAASSAGGVAASAAAPEAPPAGERTAEVSSQIITSFVTDLSVTLAPDAASSGPAHVLQIPNLGLRVATDNPARWVQKIEADRAKLITQLLERLSRAKYDELLKSGGELYLKRLIEDAVCESIGLDRYPPVSALGAANSNPSPQLEALLAQPYRLR